MRVRIIKRSTLAFAVVLILVGLATAFVKAHNPSLSIIGIILGSFGYTYGALLGVFMVALFTRSRGSELGNRVAMIAGIVCVAYLSNLPNDVWKMFSIKPLYQNFEWLLVLSFPWRIMAGTLVTVAVALCFKTQSSRGSNPHAKGMRASP